MRDSKVHHDPSANLFLHKTHQHMSWLRNCHKRLMSRETVDGCRYTNSKYNFIPNAALDLVCWLHDRNIDTTSTVGRTERKVVQPAVPTIPNNVV